MSCEVKVDDGEKGGACQFLWEGVFLDVKSGFGILGVLRF